MPSSRSLSLRPLSATNPADIAALQSVLDAAPGYSRLLRGTPPGPDAARMLLAALPQGCAAADKRVLLLHEDGAAVGCCDIVRDHPEKGVAFIGLLLIIERAQGRGLGRDAFARLCRIAAGWQCRRLRVAVEENNPRALAFWRREGFVERLRRPAHGIAGTAVVLERDNPMAGRYGPSGRGA